MKEFIRDFNRRVAEIQKYFELVDKIEQLGALSSKSIIFPSGEYIVDSEIQKILQSHCYLLLYNLVESSIRNGITAIHDIILIEQLTYKDLSPKIKRLWLLNDKSKSFDNLRELIKSVLDDEMVSLDSSNIPISGNLDAKTIK
ncbi:MAG: hypothetical protein EAZ23_11000 [Oscillatoriales cyanobacterium]|nr:MAG: hypothetical protein EAZ23_11000 [Oscillatoriales cyanobacterium]